MERSQRRRSPSPPPYTSARQTASRTSLPSRALVTLTRRHPDKPCVTIVSLGEPTQASQDRMAVYQQQASDQGCDFSAIVINALDSDDKALFFDNARPDAIVVFLAGHPAPNLSANDFSTCLIGCDPVAHLSSPPLNADSYDAIHALDDLPARVHQYQQRQTLIRWRHPARDMECLECLDIHSIPLLHTSTSGHDQDLLPDLSDQFVALFQPWIHQQFEAMAHPVLDGYPPGPSWTGSEATPGIAPQAGVPPASSTPLAVLERSLTLPQAVTQSPVWKDLVDPSPVAAKLATLFSDLCRVDPDDRKGLKTLLGTVAHTMAIDRDFALQILALPPDVERVCDDRVSYTAYQLQTALMVREANDPASSLKTVTDIARQVYRRKWIHEAAHAKVQSINKGKSEGHPTLHTEDLETQWALVTHFTRQGLELGEGVAHEGRFTREFISRVSADDASKALEELHADEAQHFDDFLALWTPWQAFLQRTRPHDVDALKERLADPELAQGFDDEAAGQLKAIEPDRTPSPAEVRQLANQLSKQHEVKQWRQLTQQAL